MAMLSDTARLEHRVVELTARNEAIAVGRAAYGLYVLLSIWKRNGAPQKIALPSFLCQSPLAAVLLAGWEPEFCDVDLATGNVPETEWLRAIESGVQAVLFVHLFGNVGDASRISDKCRIKGVYFIEDAAQSFGGSWQGRPCGSHGDAAIVSFGHTKLIDVQHGGMILTNDSDLADNVRNFLSHHSGNDSDRSVSAAEFRKLFYAARSRLGSDAEAARHSFQGLIHIYESLIPSKWRPEVSREILARLNNLDAMVRTRREKNEMYQDMLRDTVLVPLVWSPGSVPWRAVFRIPGMGWAQQEAISEAVRSEGVDVSNWYIPSHWMIGSERVLGGGLDSTEQLSREIIQLWVDEGTDENDLRHAAFVLRQKLDEVGHEYADESY